jgi:hypothetical protein
VVIGQDPFLRGAKAPDLLAAEAAIAYARALFLAIPGFKKS